MVSTSFCTVCSWSDVHSISTSLWTNYLIVTSTAVASKPPVVQYQPCPWLPWLPIADPVKSPQTGHNSAPITHNPGATFSPLSGYSWWTYVFQVLDKLILWSYNWNGFKAWGSSHRINCKPSRLGSGLFSVPGLQNFQHHKIFFQSLTNIKVGQKI